MKEITSSTKAEVPKAEYLPLERRAFLNKSWTFITHSSRFTKAGDYIAFQLLQFKIFLVKSKITGEINAFHNVCRHRAYPVVTKDKGSSIVLGCKYHGWSYDTEGNLKKAPKFDKFPEFKMEANGLFKIPTYTTPQGLVFVNLDQTSSLTSGEIWFEQMMIGDLNDFRFSRMWSEKLAKNWKQLVVKAEGEEISSSKAPDYKKWTITELKTETSGWFGKKHKKTTSLSIFPLSSFRFEETVWVSKRLNPVSDSEVQVIYELYVKEGSTCPDEKAIAELIKEGSQFDQAYIDTIAHLSKAHYDLEQEQKTQIDASKIVQNVDALELEVYCKSTCDEAVLAW